MEEKSKKRASMIVAMMGKPKDEVPEGEAPEGDLAAEDAAQGLIDALKSGDAKLVVSAFRELRELC